MKKINVKDILYIEAQGHLCQIHLRDEQLEIKQAFNELIAEAPLDFIQTHRSFLVNLQHIFQVNKTEVVLENGLKIPLSRRLEKKVLEAFVDHYKKQAYSL